MERISVSKLLLQGRGKLKFFLTGLGFLLSMLIISVVVQLYFDLSCLLKTSESDDGFTYIQISKEVGVGTTLGLSSANFSSKEIEGIKSQEFIEDVGELLSNDFRVYGRFAGNAFDMFFTSVEDEFIDADLKDFHWEPGQVEIPVIISNQFLTILNHAVLPSQGQPPIPKVAIKQATVDLALTKDGKRLIQKARVVGFSDRISSVLVPKNFLDFANQKLSGKTATRVSMLILKVKDPTSKAFQAFLNRNDYEVTGELPLLDNAKSILKIVLGVLLVFGILILVLSIALNSSQFKLAVLQNKEKIRMLVLLGYSPKKIVTSLVKVVLMNLSVILLIAFLGLWFIFQFVHRVIENLKIGEPELSFVTFLMPILLSLVTLYGVNRTLKKLMDLSF